MLVEKVKEAIERYGKVLLLLSGGSSVNLYGKLAEYIRENKPKNLIIGQVDERFRPNSEFVKNYELRTDREINANAIGETGLWEACGKAGVKYDIVPQEGEMEEAAGIYNARMHERMNEKYYKMAVLGVGEDGHTAGLLPGYQSDWDKKRYAVGYRNDGKFPMRITLTPWALGELDYVIITAAGEKKRKALKNILRNNPADTDKYPGLILNKIKKSDLYTDMIDI